MSEKKYMMKLKALPRTSASTSPCEPPEQLAGEQEQAHQTGHQDHVLMLFMRSSVTSVVSGAKRKERDPVRSAFAWTKVSL